MKRLPHKLRGMRAEKHLLPRRTCARPNPCGNGKRRVCQCDGWRRNPVVYTIEQARVPYLTENCGRTRGRGASSRKTVSGRIRQRCSSRVIKFPMSQRSGAGVHRYVFVICAYRNRRKYLGTACAGCRFDCPGRGSRIPVACVGTYASGRICVICYPIAWKYRS